MNNKFVFLGTFSFLLLFCDLIRAESSTPSNQKSKESIKEEIKSIDQEIDEIQKQLHAAHLKVMHAEVESQTYMKNEWTNYSKEIEIAEKQQKEIEKLEQHLQHLIKKKSILQNIKEK